MNAKILLVGRTLEPLRTLGSRAQVFGHEWQLVSMRIPDEAFTALAGGGYDAVIADMDLPGINGVQFLDEVMQRFPQVLRFISAPITPGQPMTRYVGTSHQLLPNPCPPNSAMTMLQRAFALKYWLPSETVHELLGSLKKLPSPPDLYFKVVKELQSANASLETVGDLVAKDPPMCAKLLQVANSAVYGMSQEVTRSMDAIQFLGVETTKSLLLLAHSYSYFDHLDPSEFSVEALWQHSLRTGQIAQEIAKIEGASESVVGECYTAGLLHDLGKLIMAVNLPEKFNHATQLARQDGLPLWQAEHQLMGASHAEMGAGLLGIWGLPMNLVEAVALHHAPTRVVNNSFCALTAVHAANVLEHEQRPHVSPIPDSTVDMEYLASLSLTLRLDEWRAQCKKFSESGEK